MKGVDKVVDKAAAVKTAAAFFCGVDIIVSLCMAMNIKRVSLSDRNSIGQEGEPDKT